MQIVSLLKTLDLNDILMTRLLALIKADVSENLQWRSISDSTASNFSSCFEATDEDEVTYAINLFNGRVLVDGNSSGNLPSVIRENERYRDLFQSQDFEVNLIKGVYQTAYKIEECHFYFCFQAGELIVQKIYQDSDAKTKTTTLQICSSGWNKLLHKAIPPRICDMHSCWYWIERQCVLLMPKSGLAKSVLFVITFDERSTAKCF